MTAERLQGLQYQLARFIKRGYAFGIVCHGHIHIVHFHVVKSQSTLAQGNILMHIGQSVVYGAYKGVIHALRNVAAEKSFLARRVKMTRAGKEYILFYR